MTENDMNPLKNQWFDKNRFPLIAAALHWTASFWLESLILTVSPTAALFDYCVCKILLLAVLFGFWRFIYRAILLKSRELSVLLFALPYLAVLVIWFFARHPMELLGDELNLFERARQLDSFAYWFNYPSGYYWIMGIMLVPHPLGPVLIKMLLQALTAGYCLTRQRERSGILRVLPLYCLFLLPFVLDQGISAHRLPTYGMLYLFLAAKLLYDRLDGVSLDSRTLIIESAVLAVLAFWRTEGIYFSVLGAILIAVAYRVPVTKASLKKLLCYVLIFAAAAAPQVSAYTGGEAPASLRTKPLCGYALCNMFRNGLTEEMISPGDHEAIDLYLPFETIHRYNEEYGDKNYSWAFIMNDVEPGVDFAAQERFCGAVKNVIAENLTIYLKSQWGAWQYTNSQYVIDFSLDFMTLAYNVSALVWFPTLLTALFCLYSLIKKYWLTFWLAGGAFGSWVLVTGLMPAAYAKYFYVSYLLGYFLLFMGICQLLSKKKDIYG